ncbi:hypothetical protein [Pseudomarimonas salicorniae]|uniref:Uncharacterized protein n=1 Tax=Pseudomarimonas salicorniae TaxID=2933270 RepID=A0ABT0GCU3_9GAMM|nr:hypothetical protein [Lysobacter sp. CAU 1642]MCK7592354.1 hypothetical protein [Lysobacter sp. CAU 1642]
MSEVGTWLHEAYTAFAVMRNDAPILRIARLDSVLGLRNRGRAALS